MARRIEGLAEVTLAQNPWGKVGKQKGAKALGLRFERAVAKSLPGALHGQWFRFVDNNGPGFCSPDILFTIGPTLWVVECKLTDWSEADAQLNHLYRPVLRALWGPEIRSVIVAKFLTPLTQKERLVASWEEALRHDAPILHAFSSRQLAGLGGRIAAPKWPRERYVYGLTPQEVNLRGEVGASLAVK